MAVTTSRVRATVNVSNGALSSLRRESEPATRRVRENTSNGPAKSSTSTSSKIRMPTVLRLSLLTIYPPAPDARLKPSRSKRPDPPDPPDLPNPPDLPDLPDPRDPPAFARAHWPT